MITVEQLKQIPLFEAADQSTLVRLTQELVEKRSSTGDIILKEGEVAEGLYIIASGCVVVEKNTGRDLLQWKRIARFEAGEVFGEISFLEKSPASAQVKAHQETVLYIVPRQLLDELIRVNPAAAVDRVLSLLSTVGARLRSTTRELVTLYEVVRQMSQPTSLENKMARVVEQIQTALEEDDSVWFFRWNPFNDEYDHLAAAGTERKRLPATLPKSCSEVLDPGESIKYYLQLPFTTKDLGPIPFQSGALVVSPVQWMGQPEGLFLFYSAMPGSFDTAKRQLIETLTALFAPALANARIREEEVSRLKLQLGRQGPYRL